MFYFNINCYQLKILLQRTRFLLYIDESMTNINDSTNQEEEVENEAVAADSAIEKTDGNLPEIPETDPDKPLEEVDLTDPDALPEVPADTGVMGRLELESMIKRYLDEVDKLKDQMKTQKEMLNQTVENDATFSQEDSKVKEAKKVVSALRQKIMKQPAVVDAVERIKSIKEDLSDVQETISALAEQYQEVAKTNQIVKEDGEVLEIVRKYSVRKKRKE